MANRMLPEGLQEKIIGYVYVVDDRGVFFAADLYEGNYYKLKEGGGSKTPSVSSKDYERELAKYKRCVEEDRPIATAYEVNERMGKKGIPEISADPKAAEKEMYIRKHPQVVPVKEEPGEKGLFRKGKKNVKIKCLECGTIAKNGQKFCCECGAALLKEDAEVPCVPLWQEPVIPEEQVVKEPVKESGFEESAKPVPVQPVEKDEPKPDVLNEVSNEAPEKALEEVLVKVLGGASDEIPEEDSVKIQKDPEEEPESTVKEESESADKAGDESDDESPLDITGEAERNDGAAGADVLPERSEKEIAADEALADNEAVPEEKTEEPGKKEKNKKKKKEKKERKKEEKQKRNGWKILAIILLLLYLLLLTAGTFLYLTGISPSEAVSSIVKNETEGYVLTDAAVEDGEILTYEVIQIKRDLLAGQVITADDIGQTTLSGSQYEMYNSLSSEDGSMEHVVLWSERDNVLGSYAAMDISRGNILYDAWITSMVPEDTVSDDMMPDETSGEEVMEYVTEDSVTDDTVTEDTAEDGAVADGEGEGNLNGLSDDN